MTGSMFSKNFATPVELTGAARGAFRAKIESFGIARYLPTNAVDATTYSYTMGQSNDPAAAPFRAFNTESWVGDVAAEGQNLKGNLPPISIRTPIDEWTSLIQQAGSHDKIKGAFVERAERNGTAIANRLVLAQAEVLMDGKVTVAERGASYVIDFQRSASNTDTVTVLWDDPAATPIADLVAFNTDLEAQFSEVVVSQTIAQALAVNAEVIAVLFPAGGPAMLTPEQVKAAFASWGFNLVVNKDKVTNTNGVQVPLFNQKKVLLVAGSSVGETRLGVTANAIEADNGIADSERPGLFSGAIQSVDPAGYNILVDAIGLPVLAQPNNTASLTVLP